MKLLYAQHDCLAVADIYYLYYIMTKETKSIYILTGLGADHRVFEEIDFGVYQPVFINWLEPEKGETLSAYTQRQQTFIKEPSPILIGLSFGGMVAVELAKLVLPQQLILIASAKTKYELPWYFRWLGKLYLHRIIPTRWLAKHNALASWFFGVSQKEEQMLKQILNDTNPILLKWSIHQILTWQNKVIPNNVIHIHGDADRILPIQFVRPDIIVKNGGHFITVNKAREVSEILKTHLISTTAS